MTELTLRRCVAHLAGSAADLVLIDLEEQWGEREPQNRPGTGTEAANWCRRAMKTLAEVRDDTKTTEFLREIDALRHAPIAVADRIGALR